MMKSYKRLSNRYIRQNKKRTILTLIGIILSLTLISTIGLFAKGTEKSQIEQTKQIEGMSFHIMYETYNEELFNKVVNNPNIERYGDMALWLVGKKCHTMISLSKNTIPMKALMKY